MKLQKIFQLLALKYKCLPPFREYCRLAKEVNSEPIVRSNNETV